MREWIHVCVYIYLCLSYTFYAEKHFHLTDNYQFYCSSFFIFLLQADFDDFNKHVFLTDTCEIFCCFDLPLFIKLNNGLLIRHRFWTENYLNIYSDRNNNMPIYSQLEVWKNLQSFDCKRETDVVRKRDNQRHSIMPIDEFYFISCPWCELTFFLLEQHWSV